MAPTKGNGRGGVVLCLTAMLLFAISDALAKDIARNWDPLQVAWCRLAVALVAVRTLAMLRGPPPRPARPGLQILRGLGLLASTVLMIAALRAMPMTDATVLYFISPVFVVLLSILVLGEKVERGRWLGLAVGLAGILLVLRPGPSLLGAAALLPLMSAACWATSIICTRHMAADGPYTTWAWTALTGFAVTSAALPFVAIAPRWVELLPAAVMAGLWVAGHGCIVLAYGRPGAPVARLAACSYTYMGWAVLLGWIAFGDPVDHWTLAGCGLIAAGGLLPWARWRGGRATASATEEMRGGTLAEGRVRPRQARPPFPPFGRVARMSRLKVRK